MKITGPVRLSALPAIWLCHVLLGGLAIAGPEAGDEEGKKQPSTIVIDPGHGGTADSGSQKERTLSSSNNAESPGGLLEKNLTLELALLVHEKINASEEAKQGKLRAILTRETDTNPDFAERAAQASETKACIFVSIHFNATGKGSPKQSGALALVQQKKENPRYDDDIAFAESLTAATQKVISTYIEGSKARAVGDDHHLHGGQGSNLFYQLQKALGANKPLACFLEVEFMDNPLVEKAILKENRAEVFAKIAAAISATLIAHVGQPGEKKAEHAE